MAKTINLQPRQPELNPDAFIAEANQIRVDSDEAANANWELAKLSSAHQVLERLAKISGEEGYAERSGRNKVDPDTLNREFPDLIEKFNEPEYYSVAKIKAETQMKQRALQRIVDAGPQDTWNQARRFMGGLAAHALDPAEIGLMMATTPLVRFGVGGVLAKSGLAATVAKSPALGAGLNIAENAIGNVAVESIVAYEANETGLPYTVEDFAMNVLGSAVAFEGLRFGGSQLIKGGKGFYKGFQRGLTEEIINDIDRVSVAQLAEGRRIDISAVLDEADRGLRSGEPVFEADIDGEMRFFNHDEVSVYTPEGIELKFDPSQNHWRSESGEIVLSRDDFFTRQEEGRLQVTSSEGEAEIRPLRPSEPLTPEQKMAHARQLFEAEQAPERKILYSREIQEEFDRMTSGVRAETKLSEIAAMEQEVTQSLDQLVKQGLLDEDTVISINDELKTIRDRSRLEETALKAATVCVGGRRK